MIKNSSNSLTRAWSKLKGKTNEKSNYYNQIKARNDLLDQFSLIYDDLDFLQDKVIQLSVRDIASKEQIISAGEKLKTIYNNFYKARDEKFPVYLNDYNKVINLLEEENFGQKDPVQKDPSQKDSVQEDLLELKDTEIDSTTNKINLNKKEILTHEQLSKYSNYYNSLLSLLGVLLSKNYKKEYDLLSDYISEFEDLIDLNTGEIKRKSDIKSLILKINNLKYNFNDKEKSDNTSSSDIKDPNVLNISQDQDINQSIAPPELVVSDSGNLPDNISADILMEKYYKLEHSNEELIKSIYKNNLQNKFEKDISFIDDIMDNIDRISEVKGKNKIEFTASNNEVWQILENWKIAQDDLNKKVEPLKKIAESYIIQKNSQRLLRKWLGKAKHTIFETDIGKLKLKLYNDAEVTKENVDKLMDRLEDLEDPDIISSSIESVEFNLSTIRTSMVNLYKAVK